MPFRNLMEDVVVEELNGVLKNLKGKVCDCELCREDMVAWTLNRLSPKYVVTKIGYIYSRIEALKSQSKADIITKLVEAAKVVKAKPRH